MDMRKEDEDIEIEGLEQQIEEDLQNAEDTIFKCEMTVDRIRALNKIAPDNLPKDLYDIIYKQIMT
jgi:SHS2 domain-containing protein